MSNPKPLTEKQREDITHKIAALLSGVSDSQALNVLNQARRLIHDCSFCNPKPVRNGEWIEPLQ